MLCPTCGGKHDREFDVHGFCGVCDLMIRMEAAKEMRKLRVYMERCDVVEMICERRASGRV